jgi:hypothetical protein
VHDSGGEREVRNHGTVRGSRTNRRHRFPQFSPESGHHSSSPDRNRTCILAQGTITLTPAKTARKGRTLTLSVHKKLQAHLESLSAPDDPKAFVCPSLAQKPTGGRAGLSRQFVAILKKAEINREDVRAKKGQGRAVPSKSFHSLRHFFNTALLNGGVSSTTTSGSTSLPITCCGSRCPMAGGTVSGASGRRILPFTAPSVSLRVCVTAQLPAGASQAVSAVPFYYRATC